ncbi:Alpha-maltose-1-phosphate synthase [Thermoflexales bacterium]|nr:Alpha-maltose-1-phosphate synthase [Thermoflexales bacterium]
MSLRILLASDHYPPFIGGAHRQTQLLAHELQRRGHTVNVATVWQDGLPEEENDAQVQVFRLKQLRALRRQSLTDRMQRHQPPFPDPITVLALRRLIKDFQPEVIHAHGWFTYSVAAALLGLNVPLLISTRDYGYGCPTRILVYQGATICSGPALAKCLGCADKLYGTSKGWTATWGVLLGRHLLRRKVHGIHNISTYTQEITRRDFLGEHKPNSTSNRSVVETVIPSFREDDADQNLENDPQVQPYLEQLPSEKFILYVGALRRFKGVYQLLEAYARLNAPPPLVLIGTVEHDSPQAYPPGVILLQNLPHQAVMAAWDRSLFGVTPSLGAEPLGSVVYEGMSRGKAVIGTTPGGHADMIRDGETGLLVPAGDVEALTQAMQKLLAHPEQREQMGLAARERARLFTASVAVPQFEHFYQRVIDFAGGRTPRGRSHEVLESSLVDQPSSQ